MPTDPRAFWDSIYSSDAEFFGADPSILATRSLSILKQHNCETLLELGCGQGRDTLFFARNGFEVRALDWSRKSVSQLNGQIGRLELSRMVAAMEIDLAQPEQLHRVRDQVKVDAVFSHLFLCMPFDNAQLRNIFDLAYDVLRLGGLHIFSIRDKRRDKMYGAGKQIGKDTFVINGFSVRFFDEEEILNFNGRFDLIELEQAEEEPCSLSCIYSIKKERS